MTNTKHILTVLKDGKTKELYIELPTELLNSVGWDIGDTLIWEESFPGFVIKKKGQHD
jgi:hypothetical protein